MPRTDLTEPAAIAARLIDTNRYMTLATADMEGRPWVSPVYYAAVSHMELLWVSSPDARHSRNLAARPQVSIVIFDSTVAIGEARAVYLEAEAEELVGAELEAGIDVYSRASLKDGAGPWTLEDVIPPAHLRLYRATATEGSVLDAIGRAGDRRLPVELGRENSLRGTGE